MRRPCAKVGLLAVVPLGLAVWFGLHGCSPRTTPAGPAAVEEPAGPPLFEDRTPGSGVEFTYRNGEEAGNYAIIESVGGGLALFDFDGDGLLDILVVGGGWYEGKQVRGHLCKLYRNLGGFKFQDVSQQVGLDIAFQYTHGAAAFDYDNDGWTDLLLTGYNRVILLHNEPDGKGGRRFVDVTAKAGLNDHLWSTSAAWGDLDGDGFPEIYVAHYGDWGFDTNHPTDCTYDGKKRDVCQPARFKPLVHALYRNNRNGTFTEVPDAIKTKALGRGLGVQMVDVNNDARPDVYVANDTDDNFLFMNRGKAGELKLEEVGLMALVARDDRGIANGSMGVDAGDFNRTGLASILVSNYENELPALYENRSTDRRESFIHATQSSGMAVMSGKYVSWGTAFFDYDWDGWEDALIVNGHAIRYPIKIDRRQPPVLFHNDRGHFTATTPHGGPYFREPHNARGLAVGDLDNDGKLDVVIAHLNEPVTILRNVAPTDGRHWLGIDLAGKNHRDLVGSRVAIETAGGKQTRWVKGGGSFASTSDRRLVFGLGPDTAVQKVTVYWSWGEKQEIKDLKPDRYWKVTEGEAEAK